MPLECRLWLVPCAEPLSSASVTSWSGPALATGASFGGSSTVICTVSVSVPEPVKVKGVSALQAIVRDISERKKSEAEILKSKESLSNAQNLYRTQV